MKQVVYHVKTNYLYYMIALLFVGSIAGMYVSLVIEPPPASAAPITGANSDLDYYWIDAFGSGVVDDTTDANSAAAADVDLPGSGGGSGSQYWGHSTLQFDKLYAYVSSQDFSPLNYTWEYYNGSSWASLTVTNDTGAYESTGIHSFSWTVPGDWAKTALSGETPSYYVHAICNDGCSFASVDQYSIHTVSANAAPSVTPLSVTQSSATEITVTSTVADTDSDVTSLTVEYSTDNSTWYNATVDSATQSGGEGDGAVAGSGSITDIDTDNDGSIDLTFVWNIETNLPDTDDTSVYIRVTPNDGTDDGTTVTSNAFAIDTADPTAPGSLTANATSTTSIIFNLATPAADTNFSEYKIHYIAAASGVTTSSDAITTSSTDSNLGAVDFNSATTSTASGLTPCTQYVFNIAAYDMYGNSSLGSSEVSLYTLANAPGTVTTSTQSATSMTIALNTNSNSANATYAIYNVTKGNYVSATGAGSGTAVFQSASTWGTAIEVTGLSVSTGYQFQSVARCNGVDTATSTASTLSYTDVSASAQIVTGATATASSAKTTFIVDGAAGSGTGSLTAMSIPRTVADAAQVSLSLSRILSGGVATITNQIAVSRDSSVSANRFSMVIPAGTIITPASGAWDGNLELPTIQPDTSVDASALGAINKVIQVGDPNISLSLSNAVKLVFPGQAGAAFAFAIASNPPQPVSTECNSPSNPTNIPAGGECFASLGNDGILWTTHLTKFLAYSQPSSAAAPSLPGPSIVRTDSARTALPAVTINGGDTLATSRDVTLNFNIVGADNMAVSNDAEYSTSSFEPFVATKKWKLSAGSGVKTVYAAFRTPEGGITKTFASITLQDPNEIVEPAQPDDVKEIDLPENEILGDDGCPLKQGVAYKSPGSAGVWLITKDCTRRLFTSSAKYFSYFDSWSALQTVDGTTIEKIPEDPIHFLPWGHRYTPGSGSLVKIISDPKVYLLLGSSRHWIQSEAVFNGLRYVWDFVEDVTNDFLNKYEEKEAIVDATQHIPGMVVRYQGSNQLYVLEEDPDPAMGLVKRAVEADDTRYRFDRAIQLGSEMAYPDAP
ncbi:MAG: hypothetical protein COU35_05085 [Candidatus Magasanikbacteria bacterium CG10_big_fil_rev_8_21_14_0_10_47_10]|uniref:Fibronectin type-III domain-containing protein n=1 Tax=Candidatus Magasanikbacteria bacterium CG10_big_fil_rev_8_21_14_0_10_47_10 TaxID=1974652 RepID=A0A2H0TP74_9BACT|nr:MAG: hypothetical protein COU35_05085 [Candidatus Magasanikbacteria bacterium CG10_big_fil_rev_8_21_14_0_10_47_10]